MKKCCGNCKHWLAYTDAKDEDSGRCKRYPPVLMNHYSSNSYSGAMMYVGRYTEQPPTKAFETCGEHKALDTD